MEVVAEFEGEGILTGFFTVLVLAEIEVHG